MLPIMTPMPWAAAQNIMAGARLFMSHDMAYPVKAGRAINMETKRDTPIAKCTGSPRPVSYTHLGPTANGKAAVIIGFVVITLIAVVNTFRKNREQRSV